MFEQEINETIQRIARDVLQERTVLPLTEILEEPRIPERFKAFFGTEAHWWIYTESAARARDRRFDFAHPEIVSLLTYLEQVQIKHARFERDDFLSVLDSAVKLTYNYLCRPQTTLKWYVFRGEPTKSIGETLLRMDAFVDYPYFRTVFSEWVDRKKEERPTFDSISSREFERIIRRIDDQILLSCTIDDLLKLMTPLFDFFGKGDAYTIPIEAMIVFFDDKNIRKLVDFLEKERAHRSHVSPTSFVMLMEDLLNTSDDEPETDFSSVYQDDALDEVVRVHLEGGYSPVREKEAPETTQPSSASMNGSIVMPKEIPNEESLPDEEDRWEEEANEYFDHDDEADYDEVEEVQSGMEDYDGDKEQSNAAESSNPEVIEERPQTSRSFAEENEHAFFIDGEENRGDPILDLLIEPGALDLIADPSRGERENDQRPMEETEEGIEVEEVEEMRHPYDDETVDEVIAAIDLRDDYDEPFFDTKGEESEEEVEDGSDASSDAAIDLTEEENADADTLSEWEELAELSPPVEQASVEDEEMTEEERDEDEERTEGEHGEDEETEVSEPAKEERLEEFELVDEPIRSQPKNEVEVKVDGKSSSAPDDVRNYIDAMLERKVVKKIFGRNRDSYEETLDLLNNAKTWREASRILDELFIRYDVDPYSRIAIRFTDSVYGRYLSPLHAG